MNFHCGLWFLQWIGEKENTKTIVFALMLMLTIKCYYRSNKTTWLFNEFWKKCSSGFEPQTNEKRDEKKATIKSILLARWRCTINFIWKYIILSIRHPIDNNISPK